MGSDNYFGWFNRGARGLISNGGVRDTDELILQKIAIWSRSLAQSMVQVRLQFDAKNIPVAVGGVLVRPGDMIVADGDGVIVVPQEIIVEVAQWAHEEHNQDKQSRRKHYIKAGRELDDTL